MTILSSINRSPFGRYLTPLLVFVSLSSLQIYGTSGSIFWLYGIKILATAIALLYCFHGHWHEIEGKYDWLAVGLGLVVLGIWIAPEIFFPQERSVAFDPTAFDSRVLTALAISIRIAGAVLIVPLIEEIFWRSFLMRFLIRADFLSVKLGTYAHLSFWVAALTFALMHAPWQWGVAAVTAILYGGYLIKTKNLVGCILAHATTNLGLAIYVIVTGDWKFW